MAELGGAGPDGASAGGSEALRRLMALADRDDERRGARVAAGEPGVVAEAWASAKAALVALGSPIVAGALGVQAMRATQEIRSRIRTWPDTLAALAPGADGVGSLPATGRYVITSDLHRTPAGGADVPTAQGTVPIYEAMLDHYAGAAWALVENGDVEDFWIAGGSTYGVAYDLARAFAMPARGGRRRWTPTEVYGEHLRRTVRHYAGVYRRIEEGFHAEGRYVRLIGNHDDVYVDPEVAAHLDAVHPGLEVHEYLVLTEDDETVGIVTHGHQMDSWNALDLAALGRFGTWFGSTITDLPVLDVRPGFPGPEVSELLLSGEHPNLLTRVSPRLGANRDLYSLDEVWLLDAFRERWAPGSEPWLVLGHTHLPVSGARVPGRDDRWERYVNSGSAVTHQLVTAVEWDGSVPGTDPVVQLVAWHVADASTPSDAVVVEHGGRRIARRVLEPSADGSVLVPV